MKYPRPNGANNTQGGLEGDQVQVSSDQDVDMKEAQVTESTKATTGQMVPSATANSVGAPSAQRSTTDAMSALKSTGNNNNTPGSSSNA